MTLNQITLLITSIVNCLLAIIIITKNRKHPVNITFSLFALSISLWSLSLLFLQIFKTMSWSNMVFLSGFSMAFFFVPFTQVFPKNRINFKIALIFWIPIILIILTLPFQLIVKAISIDSQGNLIAIQGPLFIPYVITVVITVLYGIITIFIKYLTAIGREKIQLRLFFIGLILFSIGSIISNVVLPAVGINIMSSIGPIFSLCFIGTITYSIIRYRFMDIRITIRETLIKLIMILFFSAVFLLITFGVNITYKTIIHWKGAVLVIILSTTVLIVLYEKLFKILHSLFSIIIFQKEHDKEELIKTLGRTIHESIDIKNLLENLKDATNAIVKPKDLSLIVFPHNINSNEFIQVSNKKIEFESEFIKIIKKYSEIFVKEEIVLFTQNQNSQGNKSELIKIITFMEKNNIQVIIPLPSHSNLTGLILLGEKRYNEAYTANDISILEAIRYQAGIAIENATLFNETKSFSQKLKKEVKAATKNLSEKNHFLNILRKLDYITMNTLDLNVMCQKIVDMISWELGYSGALIALINKPKNTLNAYAISDAPDFKDIYKILSNNLQNFFVSLDNKSSLLIKVLNSRKMITTESMLKIYGTIFPENIVNKIEQATKIYFIFPISAKGKPLGVIVIGLPKKEKEITSIEKDLMQAFVEEIGIALENIILYDCSNKMNIELTKVNKELKELDKMKDEFVSVASHELRTPMTAIKGYAWMLEKGKHVNKLNERQKSYLEKITVSTERLISLVNDILDVSRIEGKKMKLELKKDSIDQIIEEAIAEVQPKAMEKDIILHFEQSNNIPQVVFDKAKISEVVINLVGNAIKFTPTAGKITINTKVKGKMLEVSVTDTGKGIARQDIPKLFKKFGRLEHSFALISENSGTGLGLYITKALVEMHGGKIWVNSKLGEGTTFTFSLRIAK